MLLASAPVRRMSTTPLVEEVWAMRANVPSYDGCYVALAMALGCPLVSGDVRLSRVPRLGVPVLVGG